MKFIKIQFNGHDEVLEAVIEKALETAGFVFSGSGYNLLTEERMMEFGYDKPNDN